METKCHVGIEKQFSGSRFCAGEDQDCRGLFRDEVSCQNSTTMSEGVSRQKCYNQTLSQSAS